MSSESDAASAQRAAADDVAGSAWTAAVDAASHRVFYTNEATLEVTWKRPTRGTVTELGDGQAADADAADLFDDGPEPGPEQESADEAAERRLAEARATACDGCAEVLCLRPRRLAGCRHALCELCFVRGPRYTGRCPVCQGADVALCPDGERAAHEAFVASVPGCVQRSEALAPELAERRALTRFTIEYGNTASGSSGSAYTVEAFARVGRVEKGTAAAKTAAAAASPGRMVTRVEFNINPDFPKSAVKATAPPFTLQRTMATQFTCAMTVVFAEALGVPPVTIPYHVRHQPVTRRCVVVYVRPAAAGAVPPRKAPPAVVVDHDAGIEVFVTAAATK
jgi:hypothetical protein